MVAENLRSGLGSLRGALKDRTAPLHDALDAALGEAARDQIGYAAFLARQYSARAPIERWAQAHLDRAIMPPPTSPLIAADLSELGCGLPAEEAFAFPAHGDPLGLAWALGGSALGNKALLARRRRSGLPGPQRFLSDTATAAYFRRLLLKLSQPADEHDVDAAVAAAVAVFQTFLAAARRPSLDAAA